jgi:xanthine dehydrogenase large subunit
MHLSRGDARTAIDAAPQRFRTTFVVGGQEQFYLEGQVAYAVPTEAGGMKVWCSTQHPSEMQAVVAHALQRPANAVQVECRRMGGGFGGKESQSALFACVAAVAAVRLQRPVKLRPGPRRRLHDHRPAARLLTSTGDRPRRRRPHPGSEVTMVSNAGHSADLSGPVMTRALCHFDNAYWLPDVALHGYSARTNTQSNTAFRGFGGPQGAIAIEFR